MDVVHEVPQAQRICPCGTPMVEIGQDISEQFDIVPMQVRVLRHIGQALRLPRQRACPRHGGFAAAAPAQEQRQRRLP